VFTLTVNLHVVEPVHIHLHDHTNPALLERVAGLESRINALTGDDMPTMKETLDRLRGEVTEARTIADGTKTLLGGLAQQIRELKGDQDALEQLASDLDATNADVAAALVDNTPAAETPATDQPQA